MAPFGNEIIRILDEDFAYILNFNIGQPDNMGFENCVEMWSQDANYKWNDCPCDGSIGKNAFICKAPATADGDINCPDCGDATEPPGVCK